MQEYTKVNLRDLVKDAILKLDSTTQSLASCFSGVTYPTNNVVKGMLFYNTDVKAFYVCTDTPEGSSPTWEKVIDVNVLPGMDDKGQMISDVYAPIKSPTFEGTATIPYANIETLAVTEALKIPGGKVWIE